ncbi:MAG: threonine--tRNA ligase, partial [Candidatus Diapherotrites archaeon]|nr:threonine--tRNA ligase [Candidatus Diapherotrites archaeon]
GNIYKKEIIEQKIEGDTVGFYSQGDFSDMCIGPHLPSTGKIQAIKLLKVAGAYWKGDEKNKMLQRIYGISFPNKKQLKEFNNLQEEIQKRDHRKLGKALDLFSFHPASAGCVYWHPKGFIILNELEKFWRQEHIKREYTEIQTPQIFNKSMWEQSGHWEHYKDEMFTFEVEDSIYSLKPMNCPDSIAMYQTKKRSYKELPLRFNEIGRIFRNELSGTLGGLFRVRQITQDDAHLFVTREQIQGEIITIMELIKSFYAIFGFKPEIYLSTRPDKAMGSKEMWDKAESDLKKALEANKMEYGLKEKDGAFYGPKIDIHMTDCLNRDWQLATIQLDFQLPGRFNTTYVGADGKEHEPVLIHRAIFGSFERFIGILTEEFAGAFPLWLSPVQVSIIPIADRHNEYAKKIAKILREQDVRVEIDSRQEKVEYKIREAQLQKMPYVLVLGDREEQ